MSFKTSADAYNYYHDKPTKIIESRANAISNNIANDVNADLDSFGAEIDALSCIIEERNSKPTNTNDNVSKIIMTGNTNSDNEDVASTPEYRSAFYKTLTNRTLTGEETNAYHLANETRAAGFNTLSNSAAVVPTQTLDEIVSKAKDKGGIMSIARGFNVPSNVAIPVGTPTSMAQWHTEGATVASEKVDTSSVTFSGNEILKILSMSAAVNTMSIGAFESYLTTELTDSVMGCLAKSMVDGDGSGKAEGILTGIEWVDGQNAIILADEDWGSWRDFTKLVGMLHRGYGQSAKWVCNNETLWTTIYSLYDDNNRPLYLENHLDNGGNGRLLGHEVVVDDFMPTNAIIFGDFSAYGYNLPQSIQIDVSHESSFNRGLIDYRALCVADAKTINPDAFVLMQIGA